MSNPNIIEIGSMLIDMSQNSICYQEQDVYLGPLRTHLLGFLCKNANKVVSREDLSNAVWGRVVSDHTINQHISQLRKILQASNNTELSIATIPKKGYIVRAENIAMPMDDENESPLLRVLLLESDENNLDAYNELQQLGCMANIDVVANESDFHNMSMASEYDAVVIDAGLPNSQGLALIKAIRIGETSLSADMPVVMTASYTQRSLLGFSVLCDVQSLVIKPLDMELLSKQIQQSVSAPLKLKPRAAYELIPTSLCEESVKPRVAVVVD